MRATAAGPVAALAVGLLLLAMPLRREVEGLSMAPGLLPGERVSSGWFPAIDRRPPRRHERWILRTPDGTEAIKRIVGCGGETVRFADGDLEIDGRVEPPPPWCLVERATVVERLDGPLHPAEDASTPPGSGRLLWRGEASPPLDDARFAPGERRVLLPVRDGGVCVRGRLLGGEARPGVDRVTIGIGGRLAVWRPSSGDRFTMLAGRVDRHLLAVAWTDTGEPTGSTVVPDRLPQQPPAEWSLRAPWGGRDDEEPPPLTVSLAGRAVTVDEIIVWRDVLYRPAADGRSEWSLEPGEVFVLGDFPSGSIDSRHFGPLPSRRLACRLGGRDPRSVSR